MPPFPGRRETGDSRPCSVIALSLERALLNFSSQISKHVEKENDLNSALRGSE